MSAPRVVRLLTTAIKGLRVTAVPHIQLAASGAVGNREFFLVDDNDKVLSLQTLAALLELNATYSTTTGRLTLTKDGAAVYAECVQLGRPIEAPHAGMRVIAGHVVDGPWSALFTELVGRRVRLVKTAIPADGYDLYPVTLLGTASLAELARRAGRESVDSRRFRMLIEFDGPPAHAEDTWNGRRIEIGAAEIRVGGPVPRCVATMRNPESGESDQPIVKVIHSYRGVGATEWGHGVHFGVYATVVRPGTVCVGDPLTWLS